MKKTIAICCMLATLTTYSQVGIGTTTPNANAALDISATGKGLLIPRMDSITRVGISNPPEGLMVFQNDGRKGFWYAISNTWLYIPDKLNSGDNLGNHTATQTLNIQDQLIVGSNIVNGTPSSSGLRVSGLGYLGIGMVPGERLDVAGAARAEQFKYSTPQTRVLSIPLDAFSSVWPSTYNIYKEVVSFNNNNYTTNNILLNTGTPNTEGFISAPVNLPDGAHITKFEFTGMNKEASTINTQATLSGIQSVTNGLSAALLATAAITSKSDYWQTVSTSIDHTVRNDYYNYKVVVRLSQYSGATALSGVRITYTISNTD